MDSFSGNWAATVPISTFVCLWAIYIFPWAGDRSIYFLQKNINLEIGTLAALFLFWEYLLWIFGIGSLQCMRKNMDLEGNVRLELPCIAYCLVVGEGFDRSGKTKHKQPMWPDGLGFCMDSRVQWFWLFFAVVLTTPNHALGRVSDRQDDDIACSSRYSIICFCSGI